jgi:NAD(P)H-flavin reductase
LRIAVLKTAYLFMANPIKTPSEVASIVKHDEGIYTVSFIPQRRIPRFVAGQFLHLTLDKYDPQGGFWPESRVFSIASAPMMQNIEIIYSVKGCYTTRMQKELEIGKQVWLKLPYGEFSIDTTATLNQNIVLVAGGTGISPYLSYLRTVLIGSQGTRRIHLIYGIRNEKHMLCYKDLSIYCSTVKDFSMDLFVENSTNKVFSFAQQHKGIIQIERILEIGKTMKDPLYFLSGPPSMIQACKRGLTTAGIKPHQIIIDNWEY